MCWIPFMCVCVYGCGVQDMCVRVWMWRAGHRAATRHVAITTRGNDAPVRAMHANNHRAYFFLNPLFKHRVCAKDFAWFLFTCTLFLSCFYCCYCFPYCLFVLFCLKFIVHISRGDGAIGFLLLLFREVQVLTQKILRNLHFLFTSILCIR